MRIFKYKLSISDEQSIDMPANPKILCVQLQHGIPMLWALVNERNGNRPRRILIYGTGQQLDDMPTHSYIGTFQASGGEFVWHVFDGGNIHTFNELSTVR